MVQMFYENGLPVKTSTEFYKSGDVTVSYTHLTLPTILLV